MNANSSRLAENYREIVERIAAAAKRAGRTPAEITLVAVTKYAHWSWVTGLLSLGGRFDLGEARPQQLVERAALVGPEHQVCWHLIGHLQRNKARKVLPVAGWIHSVDSLKLLADLDRLASEMNLRPRVLLEVNVSGEASKDGFSAAGLEANWEQVQNCTHLSVEGLMTMAPVEAAGDAARPTFAALRQLRDRLIMRSPVEVRLPQLSMGMTSDFEAAIEEGATFVRIGSALWDGLEVPGEPPT